MATHDEAIRSGRRFLRSNWEAIEGVVSDQSRGVPAPPQQKPCDAGAELLKLPAPERLTVGAIPLVQAMRNRRSRRTYSSDFLSLEELSFLLWATQGVRERRPTGSFRTVPSGGSRHGLETYLYVARVTGAAEGLYRFQPLDHALCPIRAQPGMRDELDRALHGQYWSSAVVFLWTVVPYRMEWRYTVVSHKILALDAGHVCQNLYLACEAVGCGTCAIGAYDQERLDGFLGVDGSDEYAVYAAPVGKALSSDRDGR